MDKGLSGFSVAPSPNCPHVVKESFPVHADLQQSASGAEGKAPKKNLFTEYRRCSTCGDDAETWVCLACSYSGCSRYKSAHMVDHVNKTATDKSHICIAISLADLSVWCFQCDEYIISPKLDKVFREMHFGKFGFYPKATLHSELPMATGVTLEIKEEKLKEDGAN